MWVAALLCSRVEECDEALETLRLQVDALSEEDGTEIQVNELRATMRQWRQRRESHKSALALDQESRFQLEKVLTYCRGLWLEWRQQQLRCRLQDVQQQLELEQQKQQHQQRQDRRRPRTAGFSHRKARKNRKKEVLQEEKEEGEALLLLKYCEREQARRMALRRAQSAIHGSTACRLDPCG